MINLIDCRAKAFLSKTDWLIIRQSEQDALNELDFERLKAFRQQAREQVGNAEMIFDLQAANEFVKTL